MSDVIGVLNAGSSSIKFSIYLVEDSRLILYLNGQIEGLLSSPKFVAKDHRGDSFSERSWSSDAHLDHDGAVSYLLDFLKKEAAHHRLIAVGHRVVHGGNRFIEPVRVDDTILNELDRLIPLAPLHQQHNLAPIRAIMNRAPQLTQVACFDTSFHHTNPPLSRLYGLPLEYAEGGLQRYGFHGLSYEYISSILPQHDPNAARGRTIVLHLGNGASMCALAGGKSVACTMGFSSVDGLLMGTRSGALDPGVLLYLMDQKKMNAREIEQLIYNNSGLLGISGFSSDMRQLLASEDPRAKLAVDVFVYRIARELGSMVAALGGLDAIVFTAGIGEHAPIIRARVCRDAAWTGVALDEKANTNGGPCITAADSKVSAWVIPTNEELIIARHTQKLISK